MLAFEPAERPGIHALAAELRRCAAQATGARRPRMVLAAAATLLSVASAFFGFHSLATRPAPPAHLNPALAEHSTAVVPFENLSREPDSASLATEVHEDRSSKLAKITDLKVGPPATIPAPFVEVDQTVVSSLKQDRTAAQIAKLRHRHIKIVRVPTRERTLWDKLLYGWGTTPAPFVETDRTVIPAVKQDRTAAQIAKVRHRHKRVVRPRTLWDKVRYGLLVKHSQYAKKN